MYEERFYRHSFSGKHSLEIAYRESDIYIISDKTLDKHRAEDILRKYYTQIEEYVSKNPCFLNSLSPLEIDRSAPLIIQDMFKASQLAGIGPFSSVAGAVAYYIGKELLAYCEEIIVENGGDIFLKAKKEKIIGLYLGENFEPNRVNVEIGQKNHCFGVCSSSSNIGPSLNFGKADLVTIVSSDSISADALATAYSNKVKKEKDIALVLKEAQNNSLIDAIVIAFENKLFLWGGIQLCEV